MQDNNSYLFHLSLYKLHAMNEVKALVILNHLLRLNGQEVCALIQREGSAQQALDTIKNWNSESHWQRDWELIEEQRVTLLSLFDNTYPAVFKELPDPPLLLYIKGALLPSDLESVAIVGTRSCSSYGLERAEKIAHDLAASQIPIVSGLARGIDTAAHRGALKAGRTIAIIGSGLSNLYPRENIPLSREIEGCGAVISELPMFTPPEKRHFPRRNRLLSALARAILLIEAPLKSGAMITMEHAHRLKRACLALPGRSDCETFRGNHLLIKTKKATLVEDFVDVLSFLSCKNLHRPSQSPYKPSPLNGLDDEEKGLAAHLSSEEITIDELSLRTHVPMSKLNSLLMSLVLKQVIQELPGKFYRRIV
jgi:DNA processing protein